MINNHKVLIILEFVVKGTVLSLSHLSLCMFISFGIYLSSSVALHVPPSSRPHPPVSWSPRLSWSLHISFQMGDGLAPSFLVFPLLLDVETSAVVNAVSRYCASRAVPERVIKLPVFNNFISADLTSWYGFYQYLCRSSLSFLERFRCMFLQCHYSALSAVWCLFAVSCQHDVPYLFSGVC